MSTNPPWSQTIFPCEIEQTFSFILDTNTLKKVDEEKLVLIAFTRRCAISYIRVEFSKILNLTAVRSFVLIDWRLVLHYNYMTGSDVDQIWIEFILKQLVTFLKVHWSLELTTKCCIGYKIHPTITSLEQKQAKTKTNLWWARIFTNWGYINGVWEANFGRKCFKVCETCWGGKISTWE